MKAYYRKLQQYDAAIHIFLTVCQSNSTVFVEFFSFIQDFFLRVAVNLFLMKLFKTANVNVMPDCSTNFNFNLLSSLLHVRTKYFCLSIQYLR